MTHPPSIFPFQSTYEIRLWTPPSGEWFYAAAKAISMAIGPWCSDLWTSVASILGHLRISAPSHEIARAAHWHTTMMLNFTRNFFLFVSVFGAYIECVWLCTTHTQCSNLCFTSHFKWVFGWTACPWKSAPLGSCLFGLWQWKTLIIVL